MLADGERRRDEHAWAPLERELHGAAAELGAGGCEPGDGGARELREGGVGDWAGRGHVIATNRGATRRLRRPVLQQTRIVRQRRYGYRIGLRPNVIELATRIDV